ncbi:MAG: ABC transporter substrate-binding protein [Desulfatiglandales bacterium]
MVRFKKSALAAIVLLCLGVMSPAWSGQSGFITDMVGRKVALEPGVERIITTFKPAALCVLSLGLSDRLVGVDSHSKKDPLQLSVFPEIVRLPGVGTKTTGLNLEEIIHLKPDLVLLYAQKDGIRLADRLVEQGIPALIILPETFAGLESALRLIAWAADQQGRADRVLKEGERILDLVEKRVGSISGNQRKVVYYASSMGLFSTTTGSLIQDEIICKAGGANASHGLTGYFREISPEQFIKWNPDLIAVSMHGRGQAVRVLSRPEFRQVRAVETGRMYLFPSNLAPWDFPSPLSTLSVLWLGKRLYPDRFEDVNLEAEIDRFHVTLFGKSFTAMGGDLNDRLGP